MPQAEALKHKDLRDLIGSAEPGRWLVVQPDQALPPDREITVVLAAGLPSAEGPRKTTAPQEFKFHTFGALKFVTTVCGWGEPVFPPGTPLRSLHPKSARAASVIRSGPSSSTASSSGSGVVWVAWCGVPKRR